MRAVDLFAGPGGWDVAANSLGIDPLGIEWDPAACAVRRAAGHRTLEADVAALDPLDYEGTDLLIASPPCTAFSMAGKGKGRAIIAEYADAIRDMAEGRPLDVERLDERCDDESAHLVLEPLRWALALTPTMLAFEQVPPVLPLWREMAHTLTRLHGYTCWAVELTAEQYGVPQTRRRAFLIAHRERAIEHPKATHKRYVAPRKREAQDGGLFDLPERERITLPHERDLLDWVSMAEALGWTDGPSPSPAPTVTSGGADTGGVEVFASRGARARARGAVRTNNFTAVARDADGKRSKAGSVPYERDLDVPSPTVDTTAGGWSITGLDRRQTSGKGEVVPVVPVERPAPTMTAAGLATGRDVWVGERPATTLAGDPRVFQPGGHHTPGAQSENAVRVTIEQAACLQSFPAGYPWDAAGSRSAAFRCIGNAVPPLMARAVLKAVVEP